MDKNIGISNILVGEEVFNPVSDMPMHENSLFKSLGRITKLLKFFERLLTFVCIIENIFVLTKVLNSSMSVSYLFCLLKKSNFGLDQCSL